MQGFERKKKKKNGQKNSAVANIRSLIMFFHISTNMAILAMILSQETNIHLFTSPPQSANVPCRGL